jgi:hypothetical protein
MKTAKQPVHKERRAPSGTWFTRLSPLKQDLVCIGFLYVVLLVLFRGIIFSNALFAASGDTANAQAFIKAGEHIKQTEGVDPLWMPYIFSGMPTFGNVAYVPHDVSYAQVIGLAILRFLFLHGSAAWMIVHFFLAGLFTFLLLRTWGLSHLPALFGALVFMLSPYAIGLAQEGHGSKLQALSYLPMIVLLTHLLLERRTLLMFGLFAAGVGTLLLTNHMQIVYYVLVIVGLYTVLQVAGDFKGQTGIAVRKSGLVLAGLLIGFCIASYIYLSVYEYSHFSIRGSGQAGTAGGLNWDYATNWSFHPYEIMTFFIPSFFGFSSQSLQEVQGQMHYLSLYWGTMPFVTSTAYVGILPILLSVIALIYRRNRITLVFAALTVVIFLVSFGKHFGLFYGLLFNILPFFDKFRAPVMILHLVAFTTAVMGAYGLSAILDAHDSKGVIDAARFRKGALMVMGVLWAVMLAGFLFKSGLYSFLSGFMFEKADQDFGAQGARTLEIYKSVRFEVLWSDYVKFVLLATAGLGAMLLFLQKKISETGFGAAVVGVLLVDLFIMDGKFINPVPQQEAKAATEPTPTIAFLKSQPGVFRVFPVGSLSTQGEAAPYTYHAIQSMMGYHPAKLKIYQEMIDSCLYSGPSSFPLNMGIVNMLNARYLLVPGQLPPGMFDLVHSDPAAKTYVYRNPGALERAYFVDSVVVTQGISNVYAVLNSPGFRPEKFAVLEKAPAIDLVRPAGATAEVTKYESRDIVVKAQTRTPALLVLSEVYYPAGWKAFIDGTETEIYKTNAILRSVIVPAGNHTVEFTFDPPMYNLGWTLSNAAWVLCGVCVVAGGAIEWRRRKKLQVKPGME